MKSTIDRTVPARTVVARVGMLARVLPDDLTRLLARPELASVRDPILASERIGLRPRVERVSNDALEVGVFGKLFGKRGAAPVLPAMGSKMGGVPYLEAEREWPESGGVPYAFVGQLDFADAPAGARLPSRGILAVYCNVREGLEAEDVLAYRWYAEPNAAKAVRREGKSRGTHECRVRLTLAPTIDLAPFDALIARAPSAALDEIADALTTWAYEEGATIGAYLPIGEGPRDWSIEPEKNERWLQLWGLESPEAGVYFGSLTLSSMIRERDLDAQRFDRCASLIWQ